jgi:prepilin-type processing-associated H-X9-DG protein
MRRFVLVLLVIAGTLLLFGCPPTAPPASTQAGRPPAPPPASPGLPTATPASPTAPGGMPVAKPDGTPGATPAVGADAERAAQSECLSRVKQLALASLMYCQDYDEKMAPHTRWTAVFKPYMKNEELYRCPKAPKLKVGYAYNQLLTFKGLGSIARPAEMLMLGDSDVGGANPACELSVAKLAPRHNGAGNAAFVDGHAKWMQARSTSPANGSAKP